MYSEIKFAKLISVQVPQLTLSSAGVKDSVLSNHGILQAERLGQHFAQSGFKFTNIFSSNLQRAYKTAEAIRLAQNQTDDKLEIVQLPLLQEQDFGWYEGKPFHARQSSPKSSSNRVESPEQPEPSDFKDVESSESMTRRMGIFIQDELLPLIHAEASEAEKVICVVSHGIILSFLWKTLLKLFPQQNVALAPDLLVGNRAFMPLEHLGGWSNTGYLQLEIRQEDAVAAKASKDATNLTVASNPKAASQTSTIPLLSFRMTILAINSKDHLIGLKRTRGGVGSSRHDEGQRKIEAFFKKPKVG